MAKERRLGRGLEALLGKVGGLQSQQEFQEISAGTEADPVQHDPDWMLQQQLASKTPNKIDILLIDRNPFQPRQEFEESELDQLAASLQTHGLLQPIVVRQVGGRYQIIAGERRFRAAMRAGWGEVPVHCLQVDDRQMVELALTENVQRKDLNAMEKAFSFAKYLEVYGGTHEELARRLELDRSTVSNLLRLLDLPIKLQDAVRKGSLTNGHVRALLSLPEQAQIETAEKIRKEDWSVRETERFVREFLENDGQPQQDETWNVIGADGQTRPVVRQSEQVVRLEQEFREHLGGMKVKLTQANEKGKGKLVIQFASHAEFELVHRAICQANAKMVARG